jgi:hypothetical protein
MNELITAMFTILRLVENSPTDNLKEQAIGGYQIRPIYVREVNRILALKKVDKTYVHEDARNDRIAQQMMFIYLKFWGEKYEKAMGRKADAFILGRIHNGGPTGWKKSATLDYGYKCEQMFAEWEWERKRDEENEQ